MENQNKTNGMAVASLILGIVSVVLSWVTFVGLASGIVGLVLAIMGRKKCAPGQTGMATAGLVLSIIGIVISGIWTTCTICAWCAVTSNPYYYYY